MEFIKDLLFPKKCVGCGMIGTYICLRCEQEIEWRTEEYCIVCRRRSPKGKTHEYSCGGRTSIDSYTAIWKYNAVMKRVIKHIKYRLAGEAYDDLYQIASRALGSKIANFSSLFGSIILVPIPLHAKRKRERGFNQAEIIAQSIGTVLNIPVQDVLERTRYTSPQAGIKHIGARRANMADAFRVRPTTLVVDKSFLLVDDLITSGATTNEAARALKDAGARHVAALALAQG